MKMTRAGRQLLDDLYIGEWTDPRQSVSITAAAIVARIETIENEARELALKEAGHNLADLVQKASEAEFYRYQRMVSEAVAVREAAVREALDKVLRAWGVDSVENQVLHGWRCREKVMYPEPCGHYEELLDELVAEVMKTR